MTIGKGGPSGRGGFASMITVLIAAVILCVMYTMMISRSVMSPEMDKSAAKAFTDQGIKADGGVIGIANSTREMIGVIQRQQEEQLERMKQGL